MVCDTEWDELTRCGRLDKGSRDPWDQELPSTEPAELNSEQRRRCRPGGGPQRRSGRERAGQMAGAQRRGWRVTEGPLSGQDRIPWDLGAKH